MVEQTPPSRKYALQSVNFWHYNGLHPPASEGQPIRIVKVLVWLQGNGGLSITSPHAPPVQFSDEENRARKIKRILDYRPLPGGTRAEGPWEYCVVCHPDGSMEHGTADRHIGKWRCRNCHLRSPPVWSAYNEADTTFCKECLTALEDCGFCHWVTANMLPESERFEWLRNHAPPILQLIRTRWHQADADFDGQIPPSLWG